MSASRHSLAEHARGTRRRRARRRAARRSARRRAAGTRSTMNRNALLRVRTLPASSTAPSIDRDDRLDRQHRAEHRPGAADAAALAQVLEGVERGEDVLALAPRLRPRARSCRGRRRRRARRGRVQHEVADPHRRALRVDDRDRAQPVERLGRDLRRLHRRRQLRGQVDAHDAVGAGVGEAAERLLERTDRRRGGLGQHRRRFELAPERPRCSAPCGRRTPRRRSGS